MGVAPAFVAVAVDAPAAIPSRETRLAWPGGTLGTHGPTRTGDPRLGRACRSLEVTRG